MDRRFQISLRNALVATGWVAVWLALVASRRNVMSSALWYGDLVAVGDFLYFSVPCIAIGTLLGRPWTGLVCGLASAGTFFVWSLQYSYLYGC